MSMGVLPFALIQLTPTRVAFTLGPLTVDWYGIGYVLAIAAGSWLTVREAARHGENPEHVWNAALLVFILAIAGARLYHVIDQWSYYATQPLKIVLPPYTGLAIYGGIAGAILGIVIYTRRHGLGFWRWADFAVPGLFIGQAIGRWGNFFNQELYGPPTDVPWAITIQCQYRVAAYPCATFPFETTGFHPLFFYESALSLLGGLVALWLSHRIAGRLRSGDLVSFWFLWYGSVRALLEPLRDAYNWTFFGVPVAILVSGAAILFGIGSIWWRHRRPVPVLVETAGREHAVPIGRPESDSS
jgi:phosphatidylglycerol:prolipoprotein diacylglycerol transferase